MCIGKLYDNMPDRYDLEPSAFSAAGFSREVLDIFLRRDTEAFEEQLLFDVSQRDERTKLIVEKFVKVLREIIYGNRKCS